MFVNMCAIVCVCAYVKVLCIHVRAYVCVCVCVYVNDVCVHVCVCVCGCVSVYLYVYKCIKLYVIVVYVYM